MAGLVASCSSLPNAANPIEWYRSVSGVDKNDDHGDERNTENLAMGAHEPFPNLGTVPPPPDRVMTARERERLEQSLASEREGAQKSNEALQGGRSIASAEPPTPDSESAPALTLLPPLTAAPPPPPPNAGPSPASRNNNASRQLPPKGSEAPPAESPGVSPSVRVTPEGETPRLAPSAPKLPPPFVAQPKVPPAPPKTAAITPQAPPPAPDLSTNAATPPPRATGATQSRSLGLVTVGPDAALSAADQGRLAEAVRLQQQGGGTLRLVGYARRGAGPEAAQQEMANFSQAINRANIVAKALADDGVPSKQIAVEAAPLPGGASDREGRTEIFLER